MDNKDLQFYIKSISTIHGLPPSLVAAIVQVESSNNIYAYRVEPHYRYLVNVLTQDPFRGLTPDEIKSEKAPIDFGYIRKVSSRDTEWWGQQASWGPMQVMGAVARELGFRGAFPELCGPRGIEYGCKHLSNLKKRFYDKYGLAGVIAAYNAGSPRRTLTGNNLVNQYYVDKVDDNIRKLGG